MGKIILITGTSSGFGKLAVPLLLQRGHTVIAGVRGGESRLSSLFAEELKLHPGRLHALDMHMEKPETFDEAERYIHSRFGGKLDVLINNAGYGLFGAIEDQSPEQIRHQFEVNFFGPVLLTRKLMPFLKAARGKILNVSSVVGFTVWPLYATYAASKYAIEGLTEGMYYDLRPHGVQVGLIEPGGFRTDFSTRSMVSSHTLSDRMSKYLQFLDKANPKLGDPMKVARAMVRLSEAGRVPLRTRVGADSKLIWFLQKIFPTGVWIRTVDLVFRKLIFR